MINKLLTLLFILSLASCKVHFTTTYRITDSKGRSYFTNYYQVKGNMIIGNETYRNGSPKPFEIPYTGSVITSK